MPFVCLFADGILIRTCCVQPASCPHRQQHHSAVLSRGFLHQPPGSAQVVRLDARHLQLDHPQTELWKKHETEPLVPLLALRRCSVTARERRSHAVLHIIKIQMSSFCEQFIDICLVISNNCSKTNRGLCTYWTLLWLELTCVQRAEDAAGSALHSGCLGSFQSKIYGQL